MFIDNGGKRGKLKGKDTKGQGWKLLDCRGVNVTLSKSSTPGNTVLWYPWL